MFSALQDGCCSSFKMRIKDDSTGDTMWLSRHGTAADKDEGFYNFTCGGEVSKLFNNELILYKVTVSLYKHIHTCTLRICFLIKYKNAL